MKKLFTNFLGLALSVMVLASCSQMATYEQADVTPEEVAAAAKDGFNLTPFGAGGNENAKTYASNSWETGCVPGNGTFGNGDFYERAFSPVVVNWGNNNSKTGNLTVYNTATKFVFRISSTAAIADLIINGVSQGVGTAANTVLSYEIDLPTNWKAGDDYIFTVAYAGGGPQIVFPQTTYEYVGICTTTTLSAGTTDPICEGAEFNLTATVSTTGANFEGGYIQILNSLNDVVASQVVTLTDKDVTYSVPTGTAGQYTYSARYVRVDPTFRYQGSVSAGTSTVVVIECGGCDIVGNEFSGEAVSCDETREAIYTFGSEDGVGYFKMQGGLTNFTGSNATVYINEVAVVFDGSVTEGASTWETGTVGGYTVGQRTPGGSSNRNIRVEGGVGTCDDVVVRVVWNSSNSGGIITGNWTVVDGGGVELATAVAGLTCPV